MRFTPGDIARQYNAKDVSRGRDYWRRRRVLSCDTHELPHGVLIRARVQGSRDEPYELTAQAEPGASEGDVKFQDECSCPLKSGCKHVVAALMEVSNRWRTEPRKRGRGRGRKTTGTVVEVVEAAPAPGRRGARGARGTPRAVPADPAALAHSLDQWLQQLRDAQSAQAVPALPAAQKKQLLYVLQPAQRGGGTALRLYTATTLKSGQYSARSLHPYQAPARIMSAPPAFLGEDDVELLRALGAYAVTGGEFRLAGRRAAGLLRELLASERCHWFSGDTPPLREGAARPGEPAWIDREDGSQQLQLLAQPPATAVLELSPPWYVDAATGECGELHTALPPALSAAVLNAPPLPAVQAEAFAAELQRMLPAGELPLPHTSRLQRLTDIRPQPVLYFYGSEEAGGQYYGLNRPPRRAAARISFDYRGQRIKPQDPAQTLTVREGSELLLIARDRRGEQRLFSQLVANGALKKVSKTLQPWERNGLALDDYTVTGADHEAAWNSFILNQLPGLQRSGWKAEYDPDFPFRYAEIEDWYGGVTESSGEDWFNLEMGVQVGGERINLLPILVQYLRSHPEDFSPAAQKARAADALMPLSLADGRRLALPYARLQPIVDTLIELYDEDPLDAAGRLTLSPLDAMRLAELDAANAAARLRWFGGKALLETGHRLRDFAGIRPVELPQGLKAQLRPYQHEGLSWLQFLREYGFGGILADDMGLGKTVQTLAHVLIEKEAGRLDCPALVVAPTSLVGNWQREARQFAPSLRVLALHGHERKQHYDTLGEYDLVVTTYPLLPRDKAVLVEQQFHLLVLDEAQNIKNARTLAAQLVQQLKARHRICLTGTPMENHLGELWSQFHFLQPGLLGDERLFRRIYRLPIEKQGDVQRRQHLVKRIAPFILRRTKQQVARDLPPKTEIVRSVALSGAQRDLYESLRLSMDDKVRREIASRGAARSHIMILDALLKLRQTCCDPRLLKLDAAKKAHGESAKLELLMEMLPEMIEEGRRVLLFSQFTSMLELIEEAAQAQGIEYLKLTGETQNRTELVERFQTGEVPLFLISLKAGGVGLNLTAADTVIHYDPWWNPAAENQATDRAHRIGQDKPVFVYKLITEGSVEEKIMALQQRKAALLAGVVDGSDGGVLTTLGAEDLQALFEPL